MEKGREVGNDDDDSVELLGRESLWLSVIIRVVYYFGKYFFGGFDRLDGWK